MKEEMPLIKPIGVGTPLYLLIAISSCITTYTGTCIVLSILAIVFRFLVAFRSVLERQRIDIEIKSRDSIYVRKPIVDTRIDRVLLTRGIKGNGVVVRRDVDRIGSWRRTFDGPRAVIDSLIVSTIYFLWVLCCVFLRLGQYTDFEQNALSRNNGHGILTRDTLRYNLWEPCCEKVWR